MHSYKVCQTVMEVHQGKRCMAVSNDAWCTDEKELKVYKWTECVEARTIEEARSSLNQVILGQCASFKVVYGNDFAACVPLQVCASDDRSVQKRELSWKESLKVLWTEWF